MLFRPSSRLCLCSHRISPCRDPIKRASLPFLLILSQHRSTTLLTLAPSGRHPIPNMPCKSHARHCRSGFTRHMSVMERHVRLLYLDSSAPCFDRGCLGSREETTGAVRSTASFFEESVLTDIASPIFRGLSPNSVHGFLDLSLSFISTPLACFSAFL